MRLGAVAEALGVSLSFVVAETRRMKKKRLIAVQRDPSDGRAMLASLAPAGLRALQAAAPSMRRLNDRLFASLSRADLLELGRLAAAVHAASGDALAVLGRDRKIVK
jgi:DNA-binding MarR family transcriptional regulator